MTVTAEVTAEVSTVKIDSGFLFSSPWSGVRYELLEAKFQASPPICFTCARAVDEVHDKLFKMAFNNLDKKGSVDYYVCESCGNTIEKNRLVLARFAAFRKVPS